MEIVNKEAASRKRVSYEILHTVNVKIRMWPHL